MAATNTTPRAVRQRAREHFQNSRRRRGLLVAFEGPDGSGKTTQRKLFKTWLQAQDYEEEYGAARLYLHDEVPVDAGTLASLPANRLPAGLADLARRRIILDLPKQWW